MSTVLIILMGMFGVGFFTMTMWVFHIKNEQMLEQEARENARNAAIRSGDAVEQLNKLWQADPTFDDKYPDPWE